MIQNEIKEKINIQAAIEAKKRNIGVFLNAAPAKKINDELFDLVDILLVNEIESQQLLDIKSIDFKRQAEELSNYVSKIIITLGDKGVVYFEKNKKIDHIKAHSVDVKSAHGAGASSMRTFYIYRMCFNMINFFIFFKVNNTFVTQSNNYLRNII